MAYLIDTNVFLRLARKNDPDRPIAFEDLRNLRALGEELCYTSQVLAEFWNVCTHPVSARGGLGLSPAATERKVKMIERHFHLLPDNLATHQEWRRLVSSHQVKGVEVHDARLVAVMNAYSVANLLTFNRDDFKCYSGIIALDPKDVAASP